MVNLKLDCQNWLTISSFDSVFENLDPRPHWIEVFSDNGAHYHNSELITIVANWHQWYNIEVRGWYFFEPGEAKSTVDSHHAQVNFFNIIILYKHFHSY